MLDAGLIEQLTQQAPPDASTDKPHGSAGATQSVSCPCRLGRVVFGSLPDPEHPLAQHAVSAAEQAACAEWASLSAGQLIDRLLAEHVPSKNELKRRARLQPLLDAKGEAYEAAQLPGLCVRHYAGGPALIVYINVNAAHLGTLPPLTELQKGRISKIANYTRYWRRFNTVKEAAEWHDLCQFVLYGMCVASSQWRIGFPTRCLDVVASCDTARS